MLKHSLCAVATSLLMSLPAIRADAMGLGEFEYKNSCTPCHGTAGKGDGPLAEHMKKPPTDLTALQRNNGGVFPVERAYRIIEGVDQVGAHGLRDMPIWGDRFRDRTQKAEDGSFPSERDIRVYARTRILALIEYLSTLQVK